MPVLRFLRVVLSAFAKPRLGPMDESVLRVRVWPNDLDANRHLNNGRAMTLTDLGRWDLVVRSGLARVAVRRGWGTAVAQAHVRFRRSAKLFQRLTLRTRILCWDERWIYMEHRLERGPNDLVLRSLLQTAIVGAGGAKGSSASSGALGSARPAEAQLPPGPSGASGLHGGRGKSVPTAELMRALGVDATSPPMPDEVRRWLDATDPKKERGTEREKEREREGERELAAASSTAQ